MDSLHDSEAMNDLSALAWVHGELQRSLDAAHKALRRHLKEAQAREGSDVDDADPAVLRGARQQLHQGVGALELVGLPPAAVMLRASESAVARFINHHAELDAAAADTIERASFALLEYLGRLLSGKPVSPVAMFPQYRAVQALAKADRVHPADLWAERWKWRDLDAVPSIFAVADDPAHPMSDTGAKLESLLLDLLRRGRPATAQRLSDLFAHLAERDQNDGPLATLWGLAAACFEGWAHGRIAPDVYTKRVASRLLVQVRMVERGERIASERLARDLLFFCTQCGVPPAGDSQPRLAAVRAQYELDRYVPVTYEDSRLGRFDPAWLAQARKRVAAAKDAWSSVAGGELHRMAGLTEQFSLVADSIKRLYPSGDRLADELGHAVAQTVAQASAPPPALAMEVATSVLYVEASLEDGEFDHPELGERVRNLADRIAAVRSGQPPQALEAWMEELYRRVSDRQTMGSVVEELRGSLAEAEKHIDPYFRNPSERHLLIPVPSQLAAMRGVLSVLGMDQASAAVQRMREEVDALLATEIDPQRTNSKAAFDRLAGNLGALGFLIDMLGVQPQLAKSLFVFDAEAGTLSPVMGRDSRAQRTSAPPIAVPPSSVPGLVEQAGTLALAAGRADVPVEDVSRELELLSRRAIVADEPGLAASVESARSALARAAEGEGESDARAEVARVMNDFVQTASEPVGLEPAGRAPSATATAAPGDDPEMREIFLEEAREVLGESVVTLQQLAAEPSDIGAMTAIRRAFHTLKGSSRMVGLDAFGEAAWACEQLYNARLASAPHADETLLLLTGEAFAYLDDWVGCIEAHRDGGHECAAVRDAADALRLHGQVLALELPSERSHTPLQATVPMTLPMAVQASAPPAAWPDPMAHWPAAADLDLTLPADPAPAVEPAFDLEASFLLTEPEAVEAAVAPAPGDAPTPSDAPAPIDFSFDLSGLDTPPSHDMPSVEAESADTAALRQTAPPIGLPDVDFGFLLDLDGAPATPPAVTAEAAPALPEVAEVDGVGELTPALLDAFALPPDAVSAEAATSSTGDIDEVELAMNLDPQADPAEAAGVVDGVESVDTDRRADVAESVKIIGPLRIGIPLFNIYLNEADELSRRLVVETGEWSMEMHRPVGDSAVALAHSLAGNSATVGFTDLSQLARALEHALERSNALGSGTPDDAALFNEAADEIRRLLHQFAAGFLRTPPPALLQRLIDHEHAAARELEQRGAAVDAAEVPVGAEDAPVASSFAALAAVPRPPPAPGTVFPESAWVHAMRQSRPQRLDEPGAADAQDAAEIDADARMDEGVANEQAVAPAPLEPAVAQPPVEPALGLEPVTTSFVDPVVEAPAVAERHDAAPAAPTYTPLDTPVLQSLGAFPDAAVVSLPTTIAPRLDALDEDDEIDAVDALDPELFPFFEEEGRELLPQLAARLRDWAQRPTDPALSAACMRTLHTFKGGARLAGAMRLGEAAHRLETAIDHLVARGDAQTYDVERLQARGDTLAARFEALRPGVLEHGAQAADALDSPDEDEVPPALRAIADDSFSALEEDDVVAAPVPATPASRAAAIAPAAGDIDWSRFVATGTVAHRAAPAERSSLASAGAVRVRVPLLDRLVNQAGEVSIARSRIESQVSQVRSSLGDLTENLERLRGQLRDIELQGETQMASRLEAAKAAAETFDPLEFDRFTRFQELTRMMAESVNDVATVQRALQRTVDSTEDELVAQARMTRELQDDLLRTRMVEFEGLSDRLYRVVRQAAKETGKQVRLDIVGGSIEVDRGVLDRMTGAFEHLLRNCVTHGIETPAQRQGAGKDPTGAITVALTQEGNEVGVEFRDDGQGLNLMRIRDKGVAMGLLQADGAYADVELANLIFTPGFSTADVVTELSGRGVGMDVVRDEVDAMGGRIETATAWGQGTSFKLVLPLTTAVTQVVILRCGDTRVAVPSTLIELVRRVPAEEVAHAYASHVLHVGEAEVPFFWLGALLRSSPRGPQGGRTQAVVIVRSAQRRVALHVDEVVGNQEVVVKHLGAQLSRLPGLAGLTLLASGTPMLIYNPVALATVYGDVARAAMRAAERIEHSPAQPVDAVPEVAAPLVLVVDDSLTVRRVTQRLLVREGYRVALAKDGLDALERLAEETPDIVLSDIEMPRMDGFDLVRNLRGDARWRDLPVIMITSRIAQKHREHAAELGVDHYLGKPYSEEDLLSLIGRYVAAESS